MRIDYTLRPTTIRTNARYRGPTESSKYFNTIHEALHDITLLGKVIDRDEFIFSLERGQSDFIKNNMASYFSGSNSNMESNIPTSTVLFRFKENIENDSSLTDTAKWTPSGSINVNISGTGFSVNSTSSDARLTYALNVIEGQVLCVRVKARSTTNATKLFITSPNVNNGEGFLSEHPLTTDMKYKEAYIECRHKETIQIGLGIDTGTALFDEVSIWNVERNAMGIQPLNTLLKSRVNALEKEIQNIINNM